MDHLKLEKDEVPLPPNHAQQHRGVLPGGMSEADGDIQSRLLNSADVPILGELGKESPVRHGSDGTKHAQLPFPARCNVIMFVFCALRCRAAVSGMESCRFRQEKENFPVYGNYADSFSNTKNEMKAASLEKNLIMKRKQKALGSERMHFCILHHFCSHSRIEREISAFFPARRVVAVLPCWPVDFRAVWPQPAGGGASLCAGSCVAFCCGPGMHAIFNEMDGPRTGPSTGGVDSASISSLSSPALSHLLQYLCPFCNACTWIFL